MDNQPKLKRGLGLAFGADISLFNTLTIDQVSLSDLLSFTSYQTKSVFKFLFTQLMTS